MFKKSADLNRIAGYFVEGRSTGTTAGQQIKGKNMIDASEQVSAVASPQGRRRPGPSQGPGPQRAMRRGEEIA